MKYTWKLTSFFVFPIIVLLFHLIASGLLNLYIFFPHLDIPFHYTGGFAIAYASAGILSYLEQEKIIATLNRIVFVILISTLTATATVFWEFMEFIGDQLLRRNIQVSLANTMQDQFLGILGGITWAFILYKRILR